MWNLLKSLFVGRGSSPPAGGTSSARREKRYIQREGQAVETDKVFDAWTSGDLSEMVNALGVKTNLVDRHFLLMGIVNHTYKHRKDRRMRDLCKQISELHIQEFRRIAPALRKDMGGILPRVTTFQHYVTVLTEDGEYDKAIEVCRNAIAFGLHDGTKSGFPGRIARINKKRGRK